jgi:hypothetical protein
MKNLIILLMLTIVLGMAGCDTDSTPQSIGMPPPLTHPFDKEEFDRGLEAWAEQGISDYSFDVWGHEYEPNIQLGEWTWYALPPDAKFYAHVTVADGGIVSIEKIDEERGDYTWGTISDILDRILSMSEEDASSPYAYGWTVECNLGDNYSGNLIMYLVIHIYSYNPDLTPYMAYYGPEYAILFYTFHLQIENFQVTENVPY